MSEVGPGEVLIKLHRYVTDDVDTGDGSWEIFGPAYWTCTIWDNPDQKSAACAIFNEARADDMQAFEDWIIQALASVVHTTPSRPPSSPTPRIPA